MRHTDLNQVKESLPDGWEQRARAAYEEVEVLPPNERSQAIDGKSSLWRELKEILKQVSHGKCWYCESIEERSDNAVDHYRPKNRVAESPDHDGYWWLAFDWTNYRFSCTFCNSHRTDQSTGTGGGKHDHFPLLDEGRRARDPEDTLGDEQPLLLDPTCPADPPLLWFDEDGRPKPNPRFCSDETLYSYKKAKASIKLYHLDHVDANERRKILSQEIRDIAKKADYYFEKQDEGDMTARRSFADRIEELRNKLKADAEYSAAAHATLMGLRGNSAVAEMVLAEA